MSSPYSYSPLEDRLSQLAEIQARIEELEREKGEIERGLKGVKDSFENSEECLKIIIDFHNKKNGKYVVPTTATTLVKSLFGYTK